MMNRFLYAIFSLVIISPAFSQITAEFSYKPELYNNFKEAGSFYDSLSQQLTSYERQQPYITNAYDSTCGMSYNLSVQNANNPGQWTAFDGGTQVYPNFTDYTDPNTYVSIAYYAGNSHTLRFVWTDTAGQQAETHITFLLKPLADVGLNDYPAICGNTYTFDADTTVCGWATSSWITQQSVNFNGTENNPDATVTIPTTIFVDSAHAQIEFVWMVDNMGCTAYDTVRATFYQEPTANAGLNDSICGLNYELGAVFDLPDNPPAYTPTGEWEPLGSNPSTSSFVNANSDTTTVNVNGAGVYRYVWREKNTLNPSCTDRDTVKIIFREAPVINAGNYFDVCGNETTLDAITAGFNGSWLPVPGVVFDDPTDPNTEIYYGSYGDVQFVWWEANAPCTSTDTVTVTFWRKPTAALSMDPADTTTCGNEFTELRAENPGSGVNGNWISSPSNGVDFYQQAFSDTMEVSYYGVYEIRWVESNHPANQPPSFCSDTTEPWTIKFIKIPDAFAGYDTTFCGLQGNIETAQLSTDGSNVYWSNTDSNINLINDSVINVTVESDTYTEGNSNYDFFTLLYTENKNGCSDSDSIEVRFAPVPISNFTVSDSSVSINNPEINFTYTGTSVDSVFWELGDGDYSNDFSFTHTYQDTGNFIVYVNAYNSYGCYDNHSDTITVTGNNSISNYLLSDNWVYPNPAQNRINLDFNLTNYDDVKISITDIYGRLIKTVESTVKENTVTINTSDISSGVYIIKVKGRLVSDSRKIVIKQ